MGGKLGGRFRRLGVRSAPKLSPEELLGEAPTVLKSLEEPQHQQEHCFCSLKDPNDGGDLRSQPSSKKTRWA
jgi:hypothetical protein